MERSDLRQTSTSRAAEAVAARDECHPFPLQRHLHRAAERPARASRHSADSLRLQRPLSSPRLASPRLELASASKILRPLVAAAATREARPSTARTLASYHISVSTRRELESWLRWVPRALPTARRQRERQSKGGGESRSGQLTQSSRRSAKRSRRSSAARSPCAPTGRTRSRLAFCLAALVPAMSASWHIASGYACWNNARRRGTSPVRSAVAGSAGSAGVDLVGCRSTRAMTGNASCVG